MYGLKPEIPLKALKIQFNHNLHEECIIGVLSHYNLSLKLRVVTKKLKDYNAAQIQLISPMPKYGSIVFKNLRFRIEYDKSVAGLSVERFLFAIAHEIGHILLLSKDSPHCESEVATDLIAMVMGFDSVYQKSKVVEVFNQSWPYNKIGDSIAGYLSKEEISFARQYIVERRKNI